MEHGSPGRSPSRPIFVGSMHAPWDTRGVILSPSAGDMYDRPKQSHPPGAPN